MEETTGWITEAMHWLVHMADQLGYFGLFVMTLIESTIIPMPIELTLIPAGYLVHQEKMNFLLALLASVLGTLAGSSCNYWLARKFGRGLLIRYGRYFMVNDEKLTKLEGFFRDHGVISTLTGRLLPGFRHCIALPAGLARMPFPKFLFYTGVGATIMC
ncbi:MAG: hypothetical protein B7X02_01130, partial [Rhodospirillales bacterium 12-54-5]